MTTTANINTITNTEFSDNLNAATRTIIVLNISRLFTTATSNGLLMETTVTQRKKKIAKTPKKKKLLERKGLVVATTLIGGIFVLIVLFGSGMYLIRKRIE
ncbi:hypothetical protein SNEBB_006080 [Seison nebaliae]|nr:hypothetical protein SNEBB_006080 [Seison nebaliae]